MNKLLICYDISEKLINESTESNDVINFIKKQSEWIHLQKSAWVVITSKTDKQIYEEIKALLDEKMQNLLFVIDITDTKAFYNDVEKAKTNVIAYVEKILGPIDK